MVAGVAGLNPAQGMDVCPLCLYVVLSCVGRGLRAGLIIHPEESYRVSYHHRNPESGRMFQVGNNRKMNEVKGEYTVILQTFSQSEGLNQRGTFVI
jgi:hypothetical protein